MLSAAADSAIAFTTAPTLKPFQYIAHYRPDHDYSPFHQGLDAALKCFYGKGNLSTVLLKKELLRYENLHLIDHAVVDVWPNVVMVKIPKWIPRHGSLMFQKSEQSFCRFISKKDFLQAVVEYAMLQGHQAIAYPSLSDSTKMVVNSSTSGNVYELVPTQHQCECDCPAHQSLSAGFSEDAKMASLLIADPVLKGQLPDKHVFSLWATWGATSFESYQIEQQQWERRQTLLMRHKDILKRQGVSLRQNISGHFDIWMGSKKIGTVDQRFDTQQNSWWINQRQISRYNSVPGDHIHYETPEESAIALGKLCQVINEGDRALADLFGGGWDAPYSEHLVEASPDFIDDINQEARLVAATSRNKAERDPNGW